MRALIALLVMVGSFLICYAIIHAQQQKEKQLVEKLENFSHLHQPARQRRQTPQTRSQAKAQLREHAFAFVRRLAQNWQGIHLKKVDYDLKMQQAGWPLLGKEFQMGLLVLAVIGAVLLGVMLLQPVWALVGAASGVLLGLMLMNIAIARRQKAFANQLGDMLTMTSNALRAGFSFMQAVEMISREMDDPIGGEFAEVMREMRLGASLEKALEAMARRVQSKDFELVVTAVLIGCAAGVLPVALRTLIPFQVSDPRKMDYVLGIMAFVTNLGSFYSGPFGAMADGMGWQQADGKHAAACQ